MRYSLNLLGGWPKGCCGRASACWATPTVLLRLTANRPGSEFTTRRAYCGRRDDSPHYRGRGHRRCQYQFRRRALAIQMSAGFRACEITSTARPRKIIENSGDPAAAVKRRVFAKGQTEEATDAYDKFWEADLLRAGRALGAKGRARRVAATAVATPSTTAGRPSRGGLKIAHGDRAAGSPRPPRWGPLRLPVSSDISPKNWPAPSRATTCAPSRVTVA